MCVEEQVLGAVRDVHELGVRLIQLDADAFGIFKSEDGWKVVDVDNLIREGQSVDISSAYSREFSPPEWFQADDKGAEEFTPTRESNMWSLGILAIQILTGGGPFTSHPLNGGVVEYREGAVWSEHEQEVGKRVLGYRGAAGVGYNE